MLDTNDEQAPEVLNSAPGADASPVSDEWLYPARWRKPNSPRWPALPSLQGFPDSVPPFWWVMMPAATKQQLRVLRGFGLVPARPLSHGEAHHLIARCIDLASEGPPDLAQSARLEKLRYWHKGVECRWFRKSLREQEAEQRLTQRLYRRDKKYFDDQMKSRRRA